MFVLQRNFDSVRIANLGIAAVETLVWFLSKNTEAVWMILLTAIGRMDSLDSHPSDLTYGI